MLRAICGKIFTLKLSITLYVEDMVVVVFVVLMEFCLRKYFVKKMFQSDSLKFIMDDYDDSSNDCFQNSDEDTEDASETDEVKYHETYNNNNDLKPVVEEVDSNHEIKEQIYRDMLKQFQTQLEQLQDGTHPDFKKAMEELNSHYKERLDRIACYQESETNRIENDFKKEESSAIQEYEERRIELKESLLADLEEKRRMVDGESCDLFYDNVDSKPSTTRKLRRRPNDPIPLPDRRRRASPAQINYLLDDNEANDDLKLILRAQTTNVTKSIGRGNSSSSFNNSSVDVRIEEGKLFYDKKWLLRGQNIWLETSDGFKQNATIQQISTNEIWVKKANETSRSKVHISDLLSRKFIIHRRSS